VVSPVVHDEWRQGAWRAEGDTESGMCGQSHAEDRRGREGGFAGPALNSDDRKHTILISLLLRLFSQLDHQHPVPLVHLSTPPLPPHGQPPQVAWARSEPVSVVSFSFLSPSCSSSLLFRH
jgi:hypothetical protein